MKQVLQLKQMTLMQREKVHNDTDVKTILDNTEKILKGINELKKQRIKKKR